MTPSPDFLRGVRAGLAAAAKVAEDDQRRATERADAKGVLKQARYGWQERAIACLTVAFAIRSIDPTTVGGDRG